MLVGTPNGGDGISKGMYTVVDMRFIVGTPAQHELYQRGKDGIVWILS